MMKPVRLETSEAPQGRIRVEATFSADDVERVFGMARRILAFSNQIDSTSDQDIPALLLEKLGREELERRYAEGVPSLLAPWVLDALDFPTILDPLLASADEPVQGAAYTIVLEVAPRPSFELSSYDPVVVRFEGGGLSEEELNGYLLEIALDFAPYAEVAEKRPVQPGDRVTLDITTFCGMKMVSQLTSKERDFYVGEGWFSKEFDENVIGMMPGERKTFDFRALGEDSENAGDTRTFTTTVAVKRICTQSLPEMTDEWLKSHIPGVEGLDDYREKVRDRVSQERAQRDERELLAPVARVLADRLDATLSDAELQQAANEVIARFDRAARDKGMELVDYLASEGESLEAFGERVMDEARGNVLQAYALDAYFRHFDMELSDRDLDEAALQMAGGSFQAADSLRRQYEQGGRSYLLRETAARLKANKAAAAVAVVERV